MKLNALLLLNTMGSMLLLTAGCQSGAERFLDQEPISYNDPATRIETFSDERIGDPVSDTGELTAQVEQEETETVESFTLASLHEDSPNPKETIVTLRPGEDLDTYLTASHQRVLLDFHAPWCGPCRQQARILHELEPLAAETGTLIVKIDVDDHPEIAKKHSVSGIPALMMVANGTVTNRKVGVADAKLLKSWMQ